MVFLHGLLVEVYAVPDQQAQNTRLLVENIVCRHGVPQEIIIVWSRLQFSLQFGVRCVFFVRYKEIEY